MASTTSENRKRNEKKSTEQEEAHFVSRVTVILTREKERDYLLNLCVCHRGHYKALSRCQLVGSCVGPGKNFFP